MKVKTVKKFRDKHTGEIYNVGDTFECTEERYNEILETGTFVVKVATRARRKKADTE